MPCYQCAARPALAWLGNRVLCGSCWLDITGPEKHPLRWFELFCAQGVCGHPGHWPAEVMASWRLAA
jgi:hypothetical protein